MILLKLTVSASLVLIVPSSESRERGIAIESRSKEKLHPLPLNRLKMLAPKFDKAHHDLVSLGTGSTVVETIIPWRLRPCYTSPIKV